jgi:RimJ/RimL family protein N-acetyltransferase
MRAAVVHFAFAGLGAEYCLSAAFHDNHPSHAVSRKLGYQQVGRRRALRRDQPDWLIGYELARRQWEATRRDDVRIDGLDECRDLFGIA